MPDELSSIDPHAATTATALSATSWRILVQIRCDSFTLILLWPALQAVVGVSKKENHRKGVRCQTAVQV
jgi:hypothetical protein